MLNNPIHNRLEKLENWQLQTFMIYLCERMYPNYYVFCTETGFTIPKVYRSILDINWEALIIKDAKVNFDSQLEKLEDAIPVASQFDLYGVYPAIDACVALCELLHSHLSGEVYPHAVEVSKISIGTVAMFEMTKAGSEMTDEQLIELPEIQEELDIQWQLYRLLKSCDKRDVELIKSFRAELKRLGTSNICIKLQQ